MFGNLDFDYLSKLYETDPEKFEELRVKEIEKLIESAPDTSKNRLRGIQFQIDAKRKIHENSPIGACIAISNMMHESFENLRIHLNKAVNNKDPLSYQSFKYEAKESREESKAKVINLFR